MSDSELTSAGVLKIAPGFRIAALAEPPVVGGSSKEQWLTPEILSMFLFHTMRPLSMAEERTVLRSRVNSPNAALPAALEDILRLTHRLRAADDASLKSVASSLSTRQLLRVARRLERFPGESASDAVQKACLARFLPSLARDALRHAMQEMDFEQTPKEDFKSGLDANQDAAAAAADAVCRVADGELRLGSTTAPVYSGAEAVTKIPETLFYDTAQNVASMEAMLQDFLLGEHLLLIGNQASFLHNLTSSYLSMIPPTVLQWRVMETLHN